MERDINGRKVDIERIEPSRAERCQHGLAHWNKNGKVCGKYPATWRIGERFMCGAHARSLIFKIVTKGIGP